MSEQIWALLDAQGNVAAQVITNGLTPTEDGSNPDGLEEMGIDRIGNSETEMLVNGIWQPRLDRMRAMRASEAVAVRNARASAALVASMGWPDGITVDGYLAGCRLAFSAVVDAIENASTAEEISAVDIEAGYPEG